VGYWVSFRITKMQAAGIWRKIRETGIGIGQCGWVCRDSAGDMFLFVGVDG